jgi:hypothetical protein
MSLLRFAIYFVHTERQTQRRRWSGARGAVPVSDLNSYDATTHFIGRELSSPRINDERPAKRTASRIT